MHFCLVPGVKLREEKMTFGILCSKPKFHIPNNLLI